MPNPSTPQTIDTRIRGQLADYVTGEIDRGIRRNFEAISNPASFLADNAPAPPTLSFAKAMTRRVCRAWARGRTPIQGALADMSYRPLCTAYLDTLGEVPGVGSLEPLFPGGQCEGVNYRISYERFVGSPASWQLRTTIGTRRGPIQSLAWDLRGGTYWADMIGTNSNGTPTGILTDNSGVNSLSLVRGLTPVRADGLPDNCGSSPLFYNPPVTVPDLPSLTGEPVEFPGFGTLPVNIDFDDDGNVIVNIPDLGLTVSVPNPLKDLEAVGDVLPPGFQGVAGEESAPSSEPSSGEDEQRNLVGVKVRLTTIPSRANASFNSTSVYYKGAYYCYLGGDSGLSQLEAYLVRGEQFFYAPPGSNRWRVEPNLGYACTVTPYFED